MPLRSTETISPICLPLTSSTTPLEFFELGDFATAGDGKPSLSGRVSAFNVGHGCQVVCPPHKVRLGGSNCCAEAHAAQGDRVRSLSSVMVPFPPDTPTMKPAL